MAKVIQVIETQVTRGDGKTTILRGVTQYWTLDGKLLAESDPCPDDTVSFKTYHHRQSPAGDGK